MRLLTMIYSTLNKWQRFTVAGCDELQYILGSYVFMMYEYNHSCICIIVLYRLKCIDDTIHITISLHMILQYLRIMILTQVTSTIHRQGLLIAYYFSTNIIW